VEWLTVDNIVTTGLVVMGICGLINLVGATIDRIHKWRQPQADISARQDAIMDKLATDKRRLDGHEARLDDTHTGMMVICAGVQALLEHE